MNEATLNEMRRKVTQADALTQQIDTIKKTVEMLPACRKIAFEFKASAIVVGETTCVVGADVVERLYGAVKEELLKCKHESITAFQNL